MMTRPPLHGCIPYPPGFRQAQVDPPDLVRQRLDLLILAGRHAPDRDPITVAEEWLYWANRGYREHAPRNPESDGDGA